MEGIFNSFSFSVYLVRIAFIEHLHSAANLSYHHGQYKYPYRLTIPIKPCLLGQMWVITLLYLFVPITSPVRHFHHSFIRAAYLVKAQELWILPKMTWSFMQNSVPGLPKPQCHLRMCQYSMGTHMMALRAWHTPIALRCTLYFHNITNIFLCCLVIDSHI